VGIELPDRSSFDLFGRVIPAHTMSIVNGEGSVSLAPGEHRRFHFNGQVLMEALLKGNYTGDVPLRGYIEETVSGRFRTSYVYLNPCERSRVLLLRPMRFAPNPAVHPWKWIELKRAHTDAKRVATQIRQFRILDDVAEKSYGAREKRPHHP